MVDGVIGRANHVLRPVDWVNNYKQERVPVQHLSVEELLVSVLRNKLFNVTSDLVQVSVGLFH